MFIYFGSDMFEQLNCVLDESPISSSFDGKCFSKLSISSHSSVNDVYIGWSYLLYKTGHKIYHSGFWVPNKEPTATYLSDIDDKYIDIICGLKNLLILSKKGCCYNLSRKDTSPKIIDLGENNGKIKCVVTDDLYTLALAMDGKVIILDDLEQSTPYELPMPVLVKEVSCGKEHVLLLSECGRVFSYGFGSRGQLGHGSIENVDNPAVIEALEGIHMKSVNCGGWHSAAISVEGDLYMWGWNESGQLGLPCNELRGDVLAMEEIETVCCLPKIIDIGDETPKVVECGSRHTAVLTESNNLWTWGWNGYGQLGHKRTLLSDKPERVDLPKHLIPVKLKCKFWSTLVVCSPENH